MFNPLAYALGKKGAPIDLMSSLMGGNGGGGGGSGTLEKSGWVKQLNEGATVSGNTIDIPAGNVNSSVALANPGGAFVSGDELVIAVTTKSMLKRLNVYLVSTPRNASWSCVNNLYSQYNYGSIYTFSIGSDTITWKFTGNITQVSIYPATTTGSTSQTAYASLEITGIKYNGETIFGKV